MKTASTWHPLYPQPLEALRFFWYTAISGAYLLAPLNVHEHIKQKSKEQVMESLAT